MNRKRKSAFHAPDAGPDSASKSIIDVVAESRSALKVEQLAELLGISKRGLYAQVERGSLPALRIGTSIRLDPKITAQWLRDNCSTSI